MTWFLLHWLLLSVEAGLVLGAAIAWGMR